MEGKNRLPSSVFRKKFGYSRLEIRWIWFYFISKYFVRTGKTL